MTRSPGADSLRPDVADLRRLEDALRAFIPRQRWFGGKARTPAGVRTADWVWLTGTSGRVLVTIVEITYDDQRVEHYHVPLVLLTGPQADAAARAAPEAVVAGPAGGASDIWIDALQDDGAAWTLVEAARREGHAAGLHGAVVGRPVISGEPDEERRGRVTRPPATHSNSVAFMAGTYVLKLLRRIEPGINPDVEIGRFLSSHPDVHVPALFGAIDYEAPAGEPATLALVQALVPSRSTGWDHALANVAAYLESVGASDTPVDLTPYLNLCATLGRRTAELHLALASDAAVPAFAPERLRPDEVRAIVDDVREQTEAALALLAAAGTAEDSRTAALQRRVLEARSLLASRIDTLGRLLGPFPRTRIHGDYHLGQVLLVEGDDFVILDFEGEPTKSLAARRAKYSPVRDVASMVRSWSYAADVGARAAAEGAHAAVIEKAARVWERRASGAFLRAYFDAAHGRGLLSDDPASVRAALDLFTLDKVVYEIQYELNNRPDWLRIPLEGLLRLLESDPASEAQNDPVTRPADPQSLF